MGDSFYIFKSGCLSRKDNNVLMTSSEGITKNLKAEVTDDIYLFGEVELNTKLLNFLAQKNINLHIFNYYGFYSGSFFPKESHVSGYLLVNQVRHYSEMEQRLFLAKEFIKAAAHNILRNITYYQRRGAEVEEAVAQIRQRIERIERAKDIEEVMGVEGNIRRIYYDIWPELINQEIEFEKRVKRPPDNMINTFLSFANSLVYTTTLAEIYKTQLNPTISFLHEPSSRRFSLSLDIAEIFKPLIAERMIFSLLNKHQITEHDFERESNFLYLKEAGRKKILQEYDERLKRTIKHKELNREVSYRHLIRLECYKLIKHIIGEKEYSGFKIWW